MKMKYRYGCVEYDSTDDEDMELLAMDIVYYENAFPVYEWDEFDSWLDKTYKPSDVYRAMTDKDMDAEIVREFASYMAVNHRDAVIKAGLEEGYVYTVEVEE